MTDRPRRTEEELAKEQIEELVHEITLRRLTSVLLIVAFVALGVLALGHNLVMIAFCCLMVALIGLMRYMDATGHLQEVRRRSTKFLHAPMSVLQRDTPPQPTTETGVRN